eukprot:CAMPEP_0119008564 /NCGR_PEP_ID=MMETSP1176-20130426/3790_1 /TAXON_ID=265551 /ORGANISM="Synedropsis recta cf, Strain CCMP1620" /LENGTH=442 /DNA_ID=CAMNT_0006960921 /DNA_START=108 /DNA_END=1436 /DNA_ORIENTATION=+
MTTSFVRAPAAVPRPFLLMAATGDDDDDENTTNDEDEEEGEEPKKVNPYNDENYPELEFIDYSDPNYVVDQGVGDEFFDAATATDDTEEQIEAMREDRRRRNDEFQFETYFEKILKNGEEFCGEWTIYKTSTFLGEAKAPADGEEPRILQAGKPIKVKSRAYKVNVDTDSEFRVDGERICHEETMVVDDDAEKKSKEAVAVETEIMGNKYWPNELKAYDFRGWQGIMCVGAGHTVSAGVPLDSTTSAVDETEGPYSELRAEVGISDEGLRMRVKLDYSVLEADKKAFHKNKASPPPSLHLKSMTVCREARGRWPKNGQGPDMVSEDDLVESEKMFGIPGASGGLYDPPPVGDDVQSNQYMMLDLEGGATVFFPYMMNQDTKVFDGYGWVTSLDWTPGKQRYQVDRKVKGDNVLGLRTLELSEVQSADAEMWRPRDGGEDMRQ